MKVFTKQFLAGLRKKEDDSCPIYSIHCKVHPGQETEAFINYDRMTLVVCCKVCERIICEQPIPDEREIKA